jgi:1-aminocyclopropane-1-carboxylate deaminase/D-cysteine desulfhydrase-like pyridoxal-dependent ACC family enzyme
MTVMLQLPTPIEQICFKGVTLYLKRDDLIDAAFSGNKARKFHYYLENEFPSIEKLISYGSSQSNAMYSMSVLAKMRGWEFEFTVDHLSDYLRENPHGNYRGALKNGMLIHVGRGVPSPTNKNTLFIEEGGRQPEAEYGIAILAQEIMEWQKEQGMEELNIFLPSGTGTTALFLQKSFVGKGVAQSTVYTCPCVGDSAYLKKQFLELEEDEKYHPTILSLEKKHHFGKLYKENYKIWLELRKQTGVEFDLLYDPLGWRVMLVHQEIFDTPVLYIHQGGVLGNESMLPRYKRKYPFID